MTFHFDGVAEHAQRGAARNGSPYASDRDYRRRQSSLVTLIKAGRDFLALAAVVALLCVAVSLLSAA